MLATFVRHAEGGSGGTAAGARRSWYAYRAGLAGRLGYAVDPGAAREERVRAAVERKDWARVADLTRQLSEGQAAARGG